MANCLAETGNPQLTEERALSKENAFYITTRSVLDVISGKRHVVLCVLLLWITGNKSTISRLQSTIVSLY